MAADLSHLLSLDKIMLLEKTDKSTEHLKVSLWDSSKGAPFDPRGPTLLLLTVVYLRVFQFLPTIPSLGGGVTPHDMAKINDS